MLLVGHVLFSWLGILKESPKKVSKSGDVVSGELLFSGYDGENRIIGCTDLNISRSFTVLLGILTNKLYFISNPREPVTLQTEHGFLVKAGKDDGCQLGTADDTT